MKIRRKYRHNWIKPFLFALLCLCLACMGNPMQTRAETVEEFTLTEEERYKPEYWHSPEDEERGMRTYIF